MFSKLTGSLLLARVAPFAVFVILTSIQDRFGEPARYWIYLGKTLAGAGMLAVVWRHIEELEWRVSWEGIAVGVAVFAMWVGLDGHYPTTQALLEKLHLAKPAIHPAWNPQAEFGNGSTTAIFFVVVRMVGSTLVVPCLEEVFFRSFVYRFIATKNFLAVPLGKFLPVPFAITALLFGFEHQQWLAGILCGCAYQGLVIWKGRLGDAVTAHALTNFLLGLWVVWKGAWQFW
jgi:uncharacterized protein